MIKFVFSKEHKLGKLLEIGKLTWGLISQYFKKQNKNIQ